MNYLESHRFSQKRNKPETDENLTNLREIVATTKNAASLLSSSCSHEPTATKSDNDMNIVYLTNLNEATIAANITPANLQVQAYQVMLRLLSKSSVDFTQVVATNTTSFEILQPLHQKSQASENEVPAYTWYRMIPRAR